MEDLKTETTQNPKINFYISIISLIISLVALGLSIYSLKNENKIKDISASDKIIFEENNKITTPTSTNQGISSLKETKFKKEYLVIWSGEIISSFAGGEDLAVKRFQENEKYNKFYVIGNGKYKEEMGTKIKIKGRLVGITCAYSNTVFGKCVGEVSADEITKIE